MKTEWIRQGEHDELVVLFNGWGMDRAIFDFIDLGTARDLLHCYDYRDPACPIDFESLAQQYATIHLVAWSMGVSVAGRVCAEHAEKLGVKLAISGSLPVIDDAQGIPVDAWQATIDGQQVEIEPIYSATPVLPCA